VPAITSALTKGQLVGTVNNARQYYLAGYQMALDGNSNADTNYQWPGDYTAPAITSLEVYSSKLVTNQYLKTGDLAKLLSGPGAIVGATSLLPAAASPFGDKGFVVMRKGGDALSLRKKNATAGSYPDQSAFQSAAGKRTGDNDGTASVGDGTGLVLAFP
jgi:hypothetical protein